MTYSSIKTRIDQARNLDHEESKEELLKQIRTEVQPLVDEMYRAIGRCIRFEENKRDIIEDNYITASTLRGEEIYVSECNLSDTWGLDRVRRHIARLDLKEAKEEAEMLDTAVRERIPESVWDFFMDRE